jgi:hypothetical protein
MRYPGPVVSPAVATSRPLCRLARKVVDRAMALVPAAECPVMGAPDSPEIVPVISGVRASQAIDPATSAGPDNRAIGLATSADPVSLAIAQEILADPVNRGIALAISVDRDAQVTTYKIFRAESLTGASGRIGVRRI